AAVRSHPRARLDRVASGHVRPPETRPFDDEHIDACAELLAARHRVHRADTPLLDVRFEEIGAARQAIEDEWRQDNASGAVAPRDPPPVRHLLRPPPPPSA